MAFVRFLKANAIYVIWFCIYFTFAWWVLGANWNSALIVSIIYAISIGIALSPIGECILRFTEGCKPLQTKEETEYLLPLFEEVYQGAMEQFPDLNREIQIYITDAMYVNAFAVGRKTVAVTRGAVATFSREELKGVIAHELGHMLHGHTKALLITTVGNLIFTAIIFGIRIILHIAKLLCSITTKFTMVGWIFVFISFLLGLALDLSIFLFVNFGQMILSENSRANEYQADQFAHEIGYGENLIKALYLLQKTVFQGKLSLSERLKASHPHLSERISRLESLEEQAYV